MIHLTQQLWTVVVDISGKGKIKNMKIASSFKDRAQKVAISAALLLAVIAPGVTLTQAFAAQVTSRSITLSSSSADASAVTYVATFTPTQTAAAYSITFCSNTPDNSVACVAPTGFDASAATSTATIAATANKLVVTHAMTTSQITDTFNNIHNPTAVGQFYGRIATYASASAATSDSAGSAGLDSGSVAMSTTNTIGVSGAVLETMTFCVAAADIKANCDLSGNANPTLKLGETVGSVKALSSTAVSTGILYTQISTNAASGAVVNLKSATTCGGLQRAGAATCDIAPALTSGGINQGDAKFGLTVGASAAATQGTGINAKGTVAASGTYNSSVYQFNYISGGATGVTSAIGDPILNTAGAPANNQNTPITFGVSIANNTPAGNYQTSLSMIATGKF